jgi:hypothetical protein
VLSIGGVGKGKNTFVENDVAGENNSPGLKIETPIPFVIGRVTKEDTGDRAWG